jgi:acyl-CoA dehydrogenase
MAYQAPVDDIMLALKASADLPQILAHIGSDLDEETIRAILEEAGRFASGVLDPLNWPGDRAGSQFVNGVVHTPPGWKDAYDQFVAGGWSGLPCPVDYGGQGLPSAVSMAVSEIWNSANLAFGVCPLLTNGAIDSVHIGGSRELKARFLPKMVSGEWTGTMNLTEPQAGSDLNAIATRAVKQADGTYKITGTKIYISYGEHELTANIIHLVLARLPDAPPGTRGISLFLVPKILVSEDGTPGARNDVICAGLEHKLGIIASPTCVMKFGEQGGATGYLVGEENHGLATMFVMMNAARLAVGVQGVAIAERATQRALAFAAERRQGRALASSSKTMDPIAVHPDVRRMLLTMQAMTAAARGICFATAAATDMAARAAEPSLRKPAEDRAALLTPIAKAFSTDTAVEVASLGIQIHGGMGFIEDTGAAQHLRDARVLPIYEGTNGIQAIDLVMRKLPLGGGTVVQGYLAELSETCAHVNAVNEPGFGHMARRMGDTLQALEHATVWMAQAVKTRPDEALASATPYLRLFSLAAGGHCLAKAALMSGGHAVLLARFFAEHISASGPGLLATVQDGADCVASFHT